MREIDPVVTTPAIPEQNVNNVQFKCHHCPRVFNTQQQLGGHSSRAHLGMSEKQKVRREQYSKRANDRKVFKIAKAIYIA